MDTAKKTGRHLPEDLKLHYEPTGKVAKLSLWTLGVMCVISLALAACDTAIVEIIKFFV